ncbi:hypothetical protein [Anaerocaecibacter muris]|uniref:hypothetical protein n=1 Tax=Anaerocaecibacter muris TaxID=2941513 RepID=UPI00203D685C|nr:hypothetical protein [Anaerocaecibacter muris]
MPGEENIDSLQIEITSSATDAAKNLNGLVSSLKKLDKIGKSANLVAVKKQLQGIARIQFDNLSVQLAAVTAYIRELQRSGKKISEIVIPAPTIETQNVTAPLGETVEEVQRASEEVREAVENFGQPTEITRPDWLDGMQSECESISDSFEQSVGSLNAARDRLKTALGEKSTFYSDDKTFIAGNNLADTLDDKFERLRLQAEILKEKFNSMVENGNIDLSAWDNLQKQLLSVRLQYQSLEQQINKNTNAVSELGNESTKSAGKFKKLFAQFKRVAFYRIVRFLLSKISQAATDGIQNIAKFSEQANSVMSGYKTEFLYMKNAVGSALLPALQALLPTMINIGDILVDITNSVGYLGAALNGQSTFIKAKKYAQDYAGALNEVKRATTGFDELNILGQQDTSAVDASQMFEEVDISGWDIAASIGKIAALTTGVVLLISAIKGVNVLGFFKKLGGGIKNLWKYLKNAKTWQKAGISIAAVAVEAFVCYDALYSMVKGTKSVGQGLLELIPVLAIVGAAMYAMWGPVGLIIAAVVAVISGVVAGIKAVSEAAKDREMEKFWKVSGVAIDEVTTALYGYFNALGIDKQQEWNETLADTISELNTAAINYNTLWAAVQNGEMSAKTIENLSNAFNDLAEAANAVNEAAIGSLMASIATGINMNITPELTARLGELVNSLEVAQDLLSAKITGINAEYQSLLNEISNNGGNYTPEQYDRLKELRAELDTYTLTDQSAAVGWQMTLDEMLKKGTVAGFNKEDVESVLKELTEERNKYIATMKESYASNVSTLTQLIALYPDLFSQDDLAALAESYNASLNEVNNQVNAVINSIYSALNANAMEDERAWYKTGFAWLYDWGYYGRKEAYEEQQAILEMIKSYLGSVSEFEVDVPAHANGGMVEDGLFMANHTELVGEFSNGKTAVANNMQIIGGIKQGVKEAMEESGGQGGDWTIQIVDPNGKIKGETIITAAERKNRRDGKTVISVGV